jgi:hypothetical protein
LHPTMVRVCFNVVGRLNPIRRLKPTFERTGQQELDQALIARSSTMSWKSGG